MCPVRMDSAGDSGMRVSSRSLDGPVDGPAEPVVEALHRGLLHKSSYFHVNIETFTIKYFEFKTIQFQQMIQRISNTIMKQ